MTGLKSGILADEAISNTDRDSQLGMTTADGHPDGPLQSWLIVGRQLSPVASAGECQLEYTCQTIDSANTVPYGRTATLALRHRAAPTLGVPRPASQGTLKFAIEHASRTTAPDPRPPTPDLDLDPPLSTLQRRRHVAEGGFKACGAQGAERPAVHHRRVHGRRARNRCVGSCASEPVLLNCSRSWGLTVMDRSLLTFLV